jgi:PhzF family phenazine biosynthesis protein
MLVTKVMHRVNLYIDNNIQIISYPFMKLTMRVVDAFTDTLFKGNSAAVVIHNDWLPVVTMANIAAENNLSETAYIKPINDNQFAIRWFSPITEIDFCGHATLASAFVLFTENPHLNTIVFHTDKVGILEVNKGENGIIVMQFPNLKPTIAEHIPQALLDAISITPKQVLRNQQAYFVICETEHEVLNITRNNDLLKTLAPYDLVVTAQAKSNNFADYDFVSRYFWPANGGDEDPVTGSIHAGLAPYWAAELGKNKLVALQASKRQGVLHCEIDNTNGKDVVIISGQAVLYMQGEIHV